MLGNRIIPKLEYSFRIGVAVRPCLILCLNRTSWFWARKFGDPKSEKQSLVSVWSHKLSLFPPMDDLEVQGDELTCSRTDFSF